MSNDYLSQVSLEIYFTQNGDTPPLNFLEKLNFVEYDHPQDSIIYAWTFEADINYELLDILESATDLTQEDLRKLSKDAILFYEHIYQRFKGFNQQKAICKK